MVGRVLATLGFAVIVILFARTAWLYGQVAGGDGWLEAIVGLGVWLFAFAVVGLLIVYQRPWNPIGWICLLFALTWALWGWSDGLLRLEQLTSGTIARPDLVAAFSHPLWVPGAGLVPFLLLLFPNGALPSPRWRPVAWILGIDLFLLASTGLFLPGQIQDRTFVNPMGIEALEQFDQGVPGAVLVIVFIFCLAASALSVVVRFRRSEGLERLQLKWLVSAAVVAAAAYPTVFIGDYPVQLVWTVIPVAIFVALRRHRLYDIDRLISRTVSYAIVVGVLAAVFAGNVFLLRGLFSSEDPIVVAVSTLAIAALFNPLRQRVQRAVDRVFNRSRYDAQLVAEEFERTLRNQTELIEIERSLTDAVAATMQPAGLGIWTRAVPTRLTVSK